MNYPDHPKCDPDAIESIDSFHITPGQERVFFKGPDYCGQRVKSCEWHLQHRRPQLVVGYWRKQAKLHRSRCRRNCKHGDRQCVIQRSSWHVFRVHDYRLNGPNNHQLLVQRCGYTKSQATWEPYAEIWESRYELVREYFHKQGQDLPLDLEPHISDTSDDEEPKETQVEEEPRETQIEVPPREPQIKEEPREIQIKVESDN
ncbi:hypothetical protein FSHL1_006890 [Fusarium sambucinum]